MGAALLYGNARLSEHRGFDSKDKAWTVGVLQGSIPQKYKWLASERHRTVRAYTELGEVSVKKGADALIWPETSLPTLFMGEDPFWKTPSLISADLGKPILFGAPYEIGGPGSGIFVNSAFLIDGFHILGRYDKIHLVPFGEYMPFNRLLPLGPGLATRSADYSPGEEMRVMSLPGSPPFSVLICYEIIFPDLSRQAINKGAKLLINITNDGWFGDSAAPYQHLAMARFRAVENRAWLIRCANTGVSVAVDPTGKIRERIPLNEKGYFNFQFPSDLEAGAFYTRFSDLFAWVCVIAVILWAVMMRRAVCRPLSHSDFQNP
jgi:apolipoprotein N-acyltransferase